MPINFAVSFNCPKILKLLIEYGANLDGQGDNCSELHISPIAEALDSGLPFIVKILIENYHKYLLRSVHEKENVEILLENGANVFNHQILTKNIAI